MKKSVVILILIFCAMNIFSLDFNEATHIFGHVKSIYLNESGDYRVILQSNATNSMSENSKSLGSTTKDHNQLMIKKDHPEKKEMLSLLMLAVALEYRVWFHIGDMEGNTNTIKYIVAPYE
ncbi:MAG: hypothetical protein GY760_12475 [Deltaproteobacteria bacterium]|nr:hypothetical protein [Deltaproteobacteria bacterium]